VSQKKKTKKEESFFVGGRRNKKWLFSRLEKYTKIYKLETMSEDGGGGGGDSNKRKRPIAFSDVPLARRPRFEDDSAFEGQQRSGVVERKRPHSGTNEPASKRRAGVPSNLSIDDQTLESLVDDVPELASSSRDPPLRFRHNPNREPSRLLDDISFGNLFNNSGEGDLDNYVESTREDGEEEDDGYEESEADLGDMVDDVDIPSIRDERIDKTRVKNVSTIRSTIAEKRDKGNSVSSADKTVEKLFVRNKTNIDTQRRLNRDPLNLTFQTVKCQRDFLEHKKIGADPGTDVCFACIHPPLEVQTANEASVREMVDMYFRNWIVSNPVQLAHEVSKFANETVVKVHRAAMRLELYRVHGRSKTDAEINSMLTPDWSPASVYWHFHKHTTHPMAMWCKMVRNEMYLIDHIWEGALFRLDTLGDEDKEVICAKAEKLYTQAMKRLIFLQNQKPAHWVIPDVHTTNLVRNSGMTSYRNVRRSDSGVDTEGF